jgi:hypothetical protein
MGTCTPPPSDSEPDLPLRNARQGGDARGIHDLLAVTDSQLTHGGSPAAGPRPPLAPRHHECRGTLDAWGLVQVVFNGLSAAGSLKAAVAGAQSLVAGDSTDRRNNTQPPTTTSR